MHFPLISRVPLASSARVLTDDDDVEGSASEEEDVIEPAVERGIDYNSVEGALKGMLVANFPNKIVWSSWYKAVEGNSAMT